MIRKIREALEKREEGFTLIELLVVVIIIGILAAIAIPVFLNQREKAYRSAAESDARNAGLAVESYFTDHNSYPNDATWTGPTTVDLAGSQITVSDQVTLDFDNQDDGTYCITAEHDQLTDTTPDALYDSAQGGIQEDPTAGCS